jgi:hypothetical protein
MSINVRFLRGHELGMGDRTFSTYLRREGTIVTSGSSQEEGPTMTDLRGALTGPSTGSLSNLAWSTFP